MKKAIYWFRNDLRLEDHPFWGNIPSEIETILPVYIITPQQNSDTQFGFPKVGKFRRKFLHESLQDLKIELQKLGSDLLIIESDLLSVFNNLRENYGDTLYFCKEYTTEELCEEEVATTIFQDFYSFHTSTLIHPEDLDFEISELPDIFTKFRHKVEKNLKIRTPFPKPTQIPKSPKFESESQIKFFEGISSVSFSPHSAILFKGGTHQAQIRLNYYLDESHKVSTYKETRNQMVGEGYSTKFSAWLANGSISPRSIYSALKKYESKFGANDSTYWVFFELLWRDYFKFVFMKYGSKPFQKGGIKGIDNHLNLNINVLQKWKNGKTADDFVNANMIELKETGFMSNRGRQNVASFWVHNLKQDWRAAAAWFESQLIDYDACSNYGNWNYIAGIGNDPRENRVFNVQKQAQMYDSEREFRDLWLND